MLLCSNGYLRQATCKCKKPVTKTASEETDERRVEDYIYKELYGQITALGDSTFPIENILVEVYDHPEVTLDRSINSGLNGKQEIKQHKLASCRTGKDGTFCVKGIRPGKYEIRLIDDMALNRTSGPWDNRSWLITINPRAPNSTKKMIEVYMDLRI
jgi:hypothetical protein